MERSRSRSSLRPMSRFTVERHGPLGSADTAAVLALLDATGESDGVAPVSEHVMLHLRHGGDDRGRNLLIRDDIGVVACAHLDVTDLVEGSSAELAVHPRARRQGYGRALVEALLSDSPDGRMRLWAHGRHPGAAALANGLGFSESRVLYQLRRSLLAPLPEPDWAPDVTVRTFVVGEDEEAWTAVNNRAFADHPDQSSWTIQDVMVREREPWFDPSGFFLVERSGVLLGFHWTKVHGAHTSQDHPHGHDHVAGELEREHGHGHDHDPIGEVYIVGVDPAAQGLGLGKALTVTGLRHLRSLRVTQAMLYVDETNIGAIALYEKLGFSRWDTDVSYRRTRS